MKILLLFCFVVIQFMSFAQININGKVVDGQTNETLIGVNVYSNELQIGTSTNSFGFFSLTQRPEQKQWTENDLSGRYQIRGDKHYKEEPRDELIEEKQFSEFNPKLKGTYFEKVYSELIKRFPIGRMRVLSKGIYNCNSWHRDPEPRIHIPIETNPGSLFIVNHHLTHLPADGSVYFTDTRGYHTALNGGEQTRTHIVAALAYEQIKN